MQTFLWLTHLTVANLQDDLDLLYSKYKAHTSLMESVKAEADDLRQKLAASENTNKSDTEVVKLVESLRAQLAASVRAEAAAREDLAKYQTDASALQNQVDIYRYLYLTS